MAPKYVLYDCIMTIYKTKLTKKGFNEMHWSSGKFSVFYGPRLKIFDGNTALIGSFRSKSKLSINEAFA